MPIIGDVLGNYRFYPVYETGWPIEEGVSQAFPPMVWTSVRHVGQVEINIVNLTLMPPGSVVSVDEVTSRGERLVFFGDTDDPNMPTHQIRAPIVIATIVVLVVVIV